MTKVIRQITMSMAALLVLALLSACGAGSGGTGAPAGGAATPAGTGNVAPAPVTGSDPNGPGEPQMDSVQGQVSQVEGQKLVIKNEAGSTVTVQLSDGTKVQNHERGAAADIKTGTSVSVIALEQNGTLQAIELQIGGGARQLPAGGPVPLAGDQPVPGMGGAGVPAGVPEPKALHGTVEKLDGSTLTLKTDDGKSTPITLGAQTFIQKVSEGNVADVKPGTHVIAAGKRNGSTFEVAQLNLMNIQMP